MSNIDLEQARVFAEKYSGISGALHTLENSNRKAIGAKISTVIVKEADFELLSENTACYENGNQKGFRGNYNANKTIIQMVMVSRCFRKITEHVEPKNSFSIASILTNLIGYKERINHLISLVVLNWNFENQDFLILKNKIDVTIILPPKNGSFSQLLT